MGSTGIAAGVLLALMLLASSASSFSLLDDGHVEVDSFPQFEVRLNEAPPHAFYSGRGRHRVDVSAVAPDGDAYLPSEREGGGSGGDPVEEEATIIKLEQKQSDVEGPIRLKVDDKNGLVEEGPYKGSERERRKSVPKICSGGGVPCKRVDSRVTPSALYENAPRRKK